LSRYPTHDDHSRSQGGTPPLGKEKDPDEFIGRVRDLFREIKKFITFIGNRKNNNASLAFLTFLLAIAAFTQAVIYGVQLLPLSQSAGAANTAANTALKELELSQRPWVSMTDIAIISPLVFDSNGVRVTIRFSHNNTGHSPAIDSFDQYEFMATYLETPSPVQKRDEFCKVAGIRSERVHATEIRKYSQTWFPGQPIPATAQLSIGSADIKKAMTEIPKRIFPEAPLPDFFVPTLVFCTAYRSSFTDTEYHTAYILELIDTKTEKVPTFMEHGEVPANELRFDYNPFYGVYAD
jgi:hypothetical protein